MYVRDNRVYIPKSLLESYKYIAEDLKQDMSAEAKSMITRDGVIIEVLKNYATKTGHYPPKRITAPLPTNLPDLPVLSTTPNDTQQ
jgi:type IV secretory pathway VirD2 relaxase